MTLKLTLKWAWRTIKKLKKAVWGDSVYLEEIIYDIQLENDKFECKVKLNREDVVGWSKSVAGFANASGGNYYIGVEDKTKIADFLGISDSIAVTPSIIMKLLHNTFPVIDDIPQLRSYFFHPSDFWLVHHSLPNNLYYKSFHSFSCYTYYDLKWLLLRFVMIKNIWYITIKNEAEYIQSFCSNGQSLLHAV